MFVDGLDNITFSIVARYRDLNKKISFLELVNFVRPKEDAVITRVHSHTRRVSFHRMAKPSTTKRASSPPPRTLHPRWITNRASLNLLQFLLDSKESQYLCSYGPPQEIMHFLQDGTFEVPSYSEELSVSQETSALSTIV